MRRFLAMNLNKRPAENGKEMGQRCLRDFSHSASVPQRVAQLSELLERGVFDNGFVEAHKMGLNKQGADFKRLSFFWRGLMGFAI